jgi:hypothetical protein
MESYQNLYEGEFEIDINFNNIITNEMIDYYIKRTKNHIRLVQKYCKILFDFDSDRFNKIIERGNIHDNSKWYNPELEPYICITWNYYCKDHGIKFEVSDKLKELMNEATEHHIKNNMHHPEYWSDQTENLINKDDRDETSNLDSGLIIDASKMDDLSIGEMCCDFCAMSEERNNTPIEWCKKVINKRWKFTDDQVKLIYKILENIWE